MKNEREEMQRLWRKLIGDLNKEHSVKKQGETKGKLDVTSLIANYPDFFEAQQKGSYKNLPVFSRYQLEKQTDTLPERIEVSFVIDNSGSMTDTKIDAARKALAVTLLSLNDFNEYLSRNAEKLNQKIEVRSESWFFGSQYSLIKNFDTTSEKEELGEIIRSIVKLDAKGGSTDDGACLMEIAKGISKQQEIDLKRGKQVKIVFEITDGASSFPGSTKKAINELAEKNVEVYAFQIGNNTEEDIKVFDYIWNEDDKNPRGIKLGEEIQELPKELLGAVASNMKTVFKGS